MSYTMPTREQYRKEETEKENQLQATFIRDKKEKTCFQNYSYAASNKCFWWMDERSIKRTRKYA